MIRGGLRFKSQKRRYLDDRRRPKSRTHDRILSVRDFRRGRIMSLLLAKSKGTRDYYVSRYSKILV